MDTIGSIARSPTPSPDCLVGRILQARYELEDNSVLIIANYDGFWCINFCYANASLKDWLGHPFPGRPPGWPGYRCSSGPQSQEQICRLPPAHPSVEALGEPPYMSVSVLCGTDEDHGSNAIEMTAGSLAVRSHRGEVLSDAPTGGEADWNSSDVTGRFGRTARSRGPKANRAPEILTQFGQEFRGLGGAVDESKRMARVWRATSCQ